ncbi:MAG: flagellar biosynthesis protein FlhB [Nitrospiraceae bacterium]|nr:flagellar biosynthesis protein FlhB [Nitrospiraceae bacterium]
MPDEAGEKRLPASAQKRRRAREEGQVVRSQDLTSAFALLAAMAALRYFGPQMMERVVALTRYLFSHAGELVVNTATAQSIAGGALLQLARVILPFMTVMMIVGVAANVLQVGILFTAKPLTPKLDKINPIKGLGNLFNLQALVKLIKSVLVIATVVYIVWLTMRGRMDELVSLMYLTPQSLVPAVGGLIFSVWWRCVLALLVLGALDFAFQYAQQESKLKMTVQEAKEEMKQFEGDPLIKRRIRQMQRQIAMQRMMANVPQADVIITNPTRYAIALRYDAAHMPAPLVVAKGARLVAERIRDLAVEHDVPIVQKPELARVLYRTVEVDDPVPGDLFGAVAEVLAYVYQIDRREEKIRERSQAWSSTPQAA